MRLLGGGVHHIHQFILVFWGHQDAVRHVAQVGDVEDAVVRRAVGADYASPVQQERDRQILQGHLLKNLVEAPLEEG